MKGVYWRPRSVSLNALILVTLLAIGGFAAVELFPLKVSQAYYGEAMKASTLALDAMEVLKAEHLKRGWKIDPSTDPAETGLVGTAITPVTSEFGSWPAKATAINPNFAAVVVRMLKEVGVKRGDAVAVGYTGSFPGMNIALCAAIQTLGLKPVIVASGSSSQWGANDPNFLWIDMERILYERGLIGFHSVAASIGGIDDRGASLSQEGRESIIKSIRANGLPLIESSDFVDSIDTRMKIYQESGLPFKVYVNVGGGAASAGLRKSKRAFKPGINTTIPPAAEGTHSVMSSFLKEGVPVIYLIDIVKLANQYGLPVTPATIPQVGKGDIFTYKRYNPWIAGAVLVLIFASLYAFLRSDLGFRIMEPSAHTKEKSPPAQMV